MPNACARRRAWRALLNVVTLFGLLLSAGTAPAREYRPGSWDRATATTLLLYIQQVGSHGLRPGDYEPTELTNALALQDGAELGRQASESFARIAEDLAIGHVRPPFRTRYFIPPNTLGPMQIERLIDASNRAGNVSDVLDALAPANPEYAALRRELARNGGVDAAGRRRIEASLERWRWLPRDLGARYMTVNIPEYRLRLVEEDREVASHRVIVGKPSTPTGQFRAEVSAVILNPAWHVPKSIIAESVGRLVRRQPALARSRGYTWSYSGGRLQVTQRPGPGNSLGQMKLDMPNPLSMYIHDTPNKELFEREDRTLSHGCIRTAEPFDLATTLLAGSGWDRARIDAAVATQETTQVELAQHVPVYVIYMTAAVQADGSVAYLKDPYKLDEQLAARLR